MRNPFRIRASQRSVSDEQFVRLFGSSALEVLEELDDPWSEPLFIRSAPGGGKTTLLRMMLPRPLQLTVALRHEPQMKPTFDALSAVDAVDENGPKILGAMVSFSTEYQDLAQIDRGNGMFRSLLNSRIVIATLRSILDGSGKVYPDDLATISISWEPESGATIPAKADGKVLFDWASEIESSFYDRMDDLGEPEDIVGGHTRLDSLKWFARCKITDSRGDLEARRLLLFDELQFLDPGQRSSLTKVITNAREPCSIWIAERLEAMSHQDLLAEGALGKRDYNAVIQLEKKWSSGNSKGFSKFAEQIANLRAAKADGFEGREFFPMVAELEDPGKWGGVFDSASTDIEARLREKTGDDPRYEQWFEAARDPHLPSSKRAEKWRATEVLIERDLKRNQGSFAFDVLPADELVEKERAVSRAADHFLRTEIAAPNYFGRESLAAVSSHNIDQYLEITGALFEEISAKVSGPRSTPPPLSVERQDAIIRQVAESRWEDLVRRLPQGYDARRLLQGLGAYCQEQTFRPTAPYVPGVTGFSISKGDREVLSSSSEEENKHFILLRDVITSLVAQNLICPRLDRKNKGQPSVVFYLNRLLCVKFGLPLGYGGWREHSLPTLHEWMTTGIHQGKSDKEPRFV